MNAIRVHPATPPAPSFSPTNPAPSSALHLDHLPIPSPQAPDEILIRVHASTIIRDTLTWPEIYAHPYTIPGHDFAGTVAATFPGANSPFAPGDEVFGMAHADRGSTWAEYTVIRINEVARKPRTLNWAAAAALPLSAQTALEALEHAGVEGLGTEAPSGAAPGARRVLITGAVGGVGIYLVQLAAAAGLRVVAATSSNTRNEEFLRGLGADEVVEYAALENDKAQFDIVVDTVGGEVLAGCWGVVRERGSLISVDSASFDFVEEHKRRGIWRDDIKALFFIVKGSARVLQALADLVDRGALKSFVAGSYPLAQAQEAYDYASGRYTGRGKIVLTV
ncbi:hypothetical protein N7462_007200 [Penicillium macrosclerotiorum]|uniref:uncharacterized protein n=1 Tax=Penicillium macrosclerotiorum TaxID=303699 RepID=UPI002548359E|nr:uncharacterized protein N7462_007200 [Penicillium macrosclerotiorum]KAJ5678956.1 hypothetical protein N7462_007200 [Penicillium macrosclerotiorum]